MKTHAKKLLYLAVVFLAGLACCWLLFQADNKYTRALPGGYGYNVLGQDLSQAAFLVDGWEYYPGQLLQPEDFANGMEAAQ